MIINTNSKKLQGVKFRTTLVGNGVVNYDGGDQKFFINSHCAGNAYKDNQTFAKKEFYKIYDSYEEYKEAFEKYAKDNGVSVDDAKKKVPEYGYYLKISYNCLGHEIFGGTCDSDPIIWYFPETACNYITNPLTYARGYFNPDKNNSFHKKGCFYITNAVDENAVIYSEMFTKSGDRNDTSLFCKDTTGKTKYVFDSYFRVKEAQFLSFDRYFNRQAVSPSYIEGDNALEKAFIRRYERVPYTVGVFSSNNDIYGKSYGEYGAKMDDEFINHLIKTMAGRLLGINIVKKGAFAHTAKVEYKPIYSCNDSINDDEGWIELKSTDDIPVFDIYQYYEESCHHEWEERKKAAEVAKAEAAERKAEKKARRGGKKQSSEEESEKYE